MALPQSLPGLLYLLGCSIEKERPPGGIAAPHLLRAAALAELRLDGAIGDRRSDPLGVQVESLGAGPQPEPDPKADVFLLGPVDHADPVLAGVLAEIAENKRRRTWIWWVRHGERETADAVFDMLVETGAIDVSKHRLLGIVPHTDVTVTDPDAVEALRTRVRGLLRGGPPVAELDPRDVALVALAAAAEMRTVFERGEQKDFRDRLDEITSAAGPVPLALHKVVQDKKAAQASGYSAATIGATAGGAGC
jgi:hypothetical protein